MEHRHKTAAKSAPLPQDFTSMVSEVLTTNFDKGLQALAKLKPGPKFEVTGAIFPTEVVLCASITHEGEIAATSAYASVDFDPKASSPTVPDLLNLCVDALGAVFNELLNAGPERLSQVADESLSALENIPFDWTALEVDKRQVYLKVDKANPRLDQMADDWLKKNDPRLAERLAEEERETEKLFVTGPKGDSGKKNGSGQIH